MTLSMYFITIIFLSLIHNIKAQTCPDSDILHIDWQALHTYGDTDTDNWPDFTYSITFDRFNLEVIIEANLSYLGYSVDKDGNELGTTYVLDFESREAHILPLDKPGTCSNRNGADFENVPFEQWFDYSTNDPPVPAYGSTSDLAYPPGGRDWYIESYGCDTVHYRGHFSYKELFDECTNYDGTEKYSILSHDEKWINLTLTFYINIVSPLIDDDDTGYYRIYQLLSAPFIVAVHKSIHVLQPVGIRLFTMSVIAVYKERKMDDFRLVVVTETAEYLKLSNPKLMTYPWDLENDHGINFYINTDYDDDTNTDTENPCLNNKAYMCSQIWEIYADDVPCPPSDFSGLYGMQFDALCNDDGTTTTENTERQTNCNRWLASYDGLIDLSTDLTWVDEICEPKIWLIHFSGSMTFYDSDDFSLDPVDDSYLYQVGEDKIYVQIEVNVPSGAFGVFSAKLINVWLCSTDPLHGQPALDIKTGQGGCLGSDVDDDGPYYAIEDYDENFNYNATHLDEDDPNKPVNVVRFSFIPPVTVRRDKLWIHAQIQLSLVDEQGRRRLAMGDTSNIPKADQTKHFMGEVKMDPTGAQPYKHFEEIEEYKRNNGFYDDPLPTETGMKYVDNLGGNTDDKGERHYYQDSEEEEPVDNNEPIPIDDNNWVNGYYDNNQEPGDNVGGPYIVVTGDVFNTLKVVTVVVGFLVIANVCFMVYVKMDKCRNEEYGYAQYQSEYQQ